jgi:hypothetical protein
MKSTSVNEQQALAQLDKVLGSRARDQTLHIGLAVRLKNRLTPEQQDQLHKMRPDHPPMGMPGGPDHRRRIRSRKASYWSGPMSSAACLSSDFLPRIDRDEGDFVVDQNDRSAAV